MNERGLTWRLGYGGDESLAMEIVFVSKMKLKRKKWKRTFGWVAANIIAHRCMSIWYGTSRTKAVAWVVIVVLLPVLVVAAVPVIAKPHETLALVEYKKE